MAPKAFKPVPGFTPAPDLNTPAAPAAQPATEAEVLASVEAIILSKDAHRIVSRLQSGTVRHDRLTATAEELEDAKVEKALRREQRCIAQGSADTDNVPQNI